MGKVERARGALEAHEVASYRRDGYVVVQGLVSPRLVAAAIDAISGNHGHGTMTDPAEITPSGASSAKAWLAP